MALNVERVLCQYFTKSYSKRIVQQMHHSQKGEYWVMGGLIYGF